MSYYSVKVNKVSGCTVILDINSVHPDVNYINANFGFALAILRDAAYLSSADITLISVDHLVDDDWMKANAKGFIDRVALSIESGSPFAKKGDIDLSKTTLVEGDHPKKLIKGRMTITVTDPAWVSHLTVGDEFNAWSLCDVETYDACAPMRPREIAPSEPVLSGFFFVPSGAWSSLGVPGLPNLIQVPAYSHDSLYRSRHARRGVFNAADLKDLDGQVVVFHRGQARAEVGTLYCRGSEMYLLCEFSSSERYVHSSGEEFEGKIGAAELVRGKALKDRKRVADYCVGYAEVRSVKVEGDSAIFSVGVSTFCRDLEWLRDGSSPKLNGFGFTLLIRSSILKETCYAWRLAPSVLAWSIEREVMRRFSDADRLKSRYSSDSGKTTVDYFDAMPKLEAVREMLASAFVAETEVLQRPESYVDPATLDLDLLDEDGQRSVLDNLLAKPWAEILIKVRVHHPSYLDHLRQFREPLLLKQELTSNHAAAWHDEIPSPVLEPTGFGDALPSARSVPETLEPGAASLVERELSALRRSVELRPISYYALSNLCQALRRIGDFDGMRSAAEAYLARNPQSVPATHLLSIAFQNLGRFDEALRVIDQCIEIDPTIGNSHWQRACVLCLTGKPKEALVALKQAAKLNPDIKADIGADPDFKSLHGTRGFAPYEKAARLAKG